MNKLKNQKGFTLIEILVVLGIIAILATIVLIAINPARQFRQARDTQRTSNVNAILNAIGQYIADTKGSIPAGIDDVVASNQALSNTGANICSLLVPKYISALPADPKATGVAADGQISESECAGAHDTLYEVNKDANGRITIYADGEEPSGTNNISVTR